MTFHEAEFAFWAIVGLAGCAVALVAVLADCWESDKRAFRYDGPSPTSWTAGPPALTVTSRKVG